MILERAPIWHRWRHQNCKYYRLLLITLVLRHHNQGKERRVEGLKKEYIKFSLKDMSCRKCRKADPPFPPCAAHNYVALIAFALRCNSLSYTVWLESFAISSFFDTCAFFHDSLRLPSIKVHAKFFSIGEIIRTKHHK